MLGMEKSERIFTWNGINTKDVTHWLYDENKPALPDVALPDEDIHLSETTLSGAALSGATLSEATIEVLNLPAKELNTGEFCAAG